MAVLYVDEYGCVLRCSAGLVVVEKDGRELASLRVQELEYVVVQENCSITSAAVTAFLRNGVDVAFISGGGEYLGKLEPALGKNISIRHSQYKAANDPSFCLSLAKRFVAGKLANMRTIVLRYARDPSRSDIISRADSIKTAARSAGSADALQQLLGIEGTGTREYFAVFGRLLDDAYKFDGRNRRPPRDPVNAMLGFAYALLENSVERAVSVCGLDPYCGFFHAQHYGRQSLVLDLMEELRPVVADSVVINYCNRGIVDAEADFEARDGGVFLNESGRQKLFGAFYNRMSETVKPDRESEPVTYDALCEVQARKLAECVRSGVPDYQPFLVR